MSNQTLKISQIYKSKTNPRQDLQKGMVELVESIKNHGILVPLIVRELIGDTYELVAGFRRLAAAREIGLEEVPVRIMKLTDQEAMEVQIIENLQRQDLHPLDEGEGYRMFLHQINDSIPELAKRVGKSETYIHQRLKLTDLIEKAKEMFRKEKITIGQAILLARMQPADQQKIINACISRGMDISDTKEWIEEEIMRDLSSAPFKKDQCKVCKKRTGCIQSLFPDIKRGDTCTDKECFDKMLWDHIDSKKREFKAQKKELVLVSTDYPYGSQGKEDSKRGVLNRNHFLTIRDKKDECNSAEDAIVVRSENPKEIGHLIRICANPHCKKHLGMKDSEYRRTPAEIKREKAKRKKERDQKGRENKELLVALKKIKWPIAEKHIEAMIEAALNYNGFYIIRPIVLRHGWEVLKSHPSYTEKGVMRPDYEKTIREEIKKMTPAEKARLVLEFSLERLWEGNKKKVIKLL